MRIVFKLADLLRDTGASASQLDYWMRLGLIVPYKDATSSGDHRQFSILNVIETALAVWLSALGMSTDRMKQIFALRRQALAGIPPTERAVAEWVHYIQAVRTGARLIGLTDDPAFQAWEREVAIVLGRFEKKPVAPDEELLHLITAQPIPLARTQHHAD